MYYRVCSYTVALVALLLYNCVTSIDSHTGNTINIYVDMSEADAYYYHTSFASHVKNRFTHDFCSLHVSNTKASCAKLHACVKF